MATQNATAQAVQPALLFMPDISGFTEFVTNTEITHAQTIIQELLEEIIESNQLNLEVSGIEGDAVFFYRPGERPRFEELLQQVQTMFTRFHRHLMLYDHQRICPCGACTAAVNLKLKFFAHYGDVAGYSVKQRNQLFGKDVIVIHRLMKNSLNKKEYVLLTDSLLNGAHSAPSFPAWFQPEEATEKYDVGEVRFKVADLEPLFKELPPVEAPVLRSSEKTRTAFTEERVIPAPITEVFMAVFDLAQRPKWMEYIKAVEMISKGSVNRAGTLHRCIISEKNRPVIVTERGSTGEDKMELVEMDDKGMGGCRYTMEKINEAQTRLRMDFLVSKNPLISTMFNWFMKGKMKKNISRSMENLVRFLQQPAAGPVNTAASSRS